MKGIRICGGATFVKYDGITVRISDGGCCELSPILYESLEWELRTEPPDSWDYIYEEEIRAMGNGTYEKILSVVKSTLDLLKEPTPM